MQKFATHLHHHTYPRMLLRWPRLIRVLYFWNGLLLQRNWVVSQAMKRLLKDLPVGARVLDAGCGEGLHLFPWAERFPQLEFLGIDQLGEHLVFGAQYIANMGLQNVRLKEAKIENIKLEKKVDLISCIGVLQYIEKDSLAVSNFYKILKYKRRILLYVPINGRVILPCYKKYFLNKSNYENSQKRRRIYSEKGVVKMMEKAGFDVQEKVYTYGVLGIIGHEIYSVLLAGIGNSRGFAGVFFLLLFFCSPIIVLLKGLDFLLPKSRGNGMLILAQKTTAEKE